MTIFTVFEAIIRVFIQLNIVKTVKFDQKAYLSWLLKLALRERCYAFMVLFGAINVRFSKILKNFY